MSEGRIIFQVTKVGMAANSRWKVFLDGKYVGDVDFKNDLQVETSKGKHSVQYKVGLQSTRVLDVEVADDDVMVECVFDGTVRNFHVIGGEDGAVGAVSVGENRVGNNTSAVATNSQSTIPKKKSSGLKIFFIICGVFLGIGFLGSLGEGNQNGEGDNGEVGNTAVSSGGGNVSQEEKTEKYFDCVNITSDCFTGAVLDCSFLHFKSVVAEVLDIGEYNSSTGGWEVVSQTSEYTEYGITSIGDNWGVVVAVSNSHDKVFLVTIRTRGLAMNNEVAESEIEYFSKVFSAIMDGNGENSELISINKGNYKELYTSGNKTVYFESGLACMYTKNNGIHEFSLISMTEEYYNATYK